MREDLVKLDLVDCDNLALPPHAISTWAGYSAGGTHELAEDDEAGARGSTVNGAHER